MSIHHWPVGHREARGANRELTQLRRPVPIVLAGQRQILAGSGVQTDVCVATAISMTGLSLQQACDMAGRIPADLLGCESISLHPGSRADLVVFDWQPGDRTLCVRQTIAVGEQRWPTT